MSGSLHHMTLGDVAYEFRCVEEAVEARSMHRRFIGHQYQFEITMTIVGIPFTPVCELERNVYRVDVTGKEPGPFCVVADSIQDACDWVKAHVRERGFAVANVGGY